LEQRPASGPTLLVGSHAWIPVTRNCISIV